MLGIGPTCRSGLTPLFYHPNSATCRSARVHAFVECVSGNGDRCLSKGRISVGPKKTLAELGETGRFSPEPGVAGTRPRSFLGQCAWAGQHDNKAPGLSLLHYGDKYFDRTGEKQNTKLAEAIAKAFIECKNIDMKDPTGPQWLLAWHMYPRKSSALVRIRI